MELLLLLLFGFVMLFGFVVLFGAPYLPTKRLQIETALDLLDLKPGQTMLELGSGDGRVMLAAAKRGIQVEGYELNPLLVLVSRIVTLKYRSYVRIHLGNFWNSDWPKTDAVFTFLLDKYMKKLDKKIIQEYPSKSIKLVSFAFKIPGKKPARHKNGIYMYLYEGS